MKGPPDLPLLQRFRSIGLAIKQPEGRPRTEIMVMEGGYTVTGLMGSCCPKKNCQWEVFFFNRTLFRVTWEVSQDQSKTDWKGKTADFLALCQYSAQVHYLL